MTMTDVLRRFRAATVMPAPPVETSGEPTHTHQKIIFVFWDVSCTGVGEISNRRLPD